MERSRTSHDHAHDPDPDHDGILDVSLGIKNVGNTCYAGSVLQALVHCPKFVEFMFKRRRRHIISKSSKSSSSSKSSREEGGDAILRDTALLTYEAWHGRRGTLLDPIKVLDAFSKLSGDLMEINDQNDAHEFMVTFLEKLHDVASPGCPISLVRDPSASRRIGRAASRMMDICDKNWLASHEEGRKISELTPILYGQLINQVTCGNCGVSTHNFEVFSNIEVVIPEPDPERGPVLDIKDLIWERLKDHPISGDPEKEGWVCSECKVRCDENPCKTRFWRTPAVLSVVIKRFQAVKDDWTGRLGMRKNTTPLKIPIDINLDKLLETEKNQTYRLRDHKENNGTYQLSSAICHKGGLHGGHYYSICLERDDSWHIHDDETTQPLDGNPSRSLFYKPEKDCYILVYCAATQ